VKIFKWIAVGLIALVVACASFLAWRVAYHWERAPARVAQILAGADPALGAISQKRIDWIIQVEDPTFWTNDGVDQSTPGAGMTTLAQGLGKHIFFERFSPGPLRFGKLELMVLTRFVLVERVSKPDILRAVLANAYLGNDQNGPVIGFAEGARRWFGKELPELTDREFLALVAMMPAPNRLDPADHASENEERVQRIERMLAGECAPAGLNDIYYERCASP
jgi:monofunctional glycosyltransferase